MLANVYMSDAFSYHRFSRHRRFPALRWPWLLTSAERNHFTSQNIYSHTGPPPRNLEVVPRADELQITAMMNYKASLFFPQLSGNSLADIYISGGICLISIFNIGSFGTKAFGWWDSLQESVDHAALVQTPYINHNGPVTQLCLLGFVKIYISLKPSLKSCVTPPMQPSQQATAVPCYRYSSRTIFH